MIRHSCGLPRLSIVKERGPWHCGWILLVAGVALAGGQDDQRLRGQQLAIQGGRIIPIAGEPIEHGVILIRDGKISAVGDDLAIPIDAQVIDATGKTVMPGFVEPHSSAAMSQANEQNPNVPFLSVVDSIDPVREYFEDSRRNGVTTVAVVPGNSTMIGGQAAIVKTAGGFVEDMILRGQAGMKLSLQPTRGESRMSHLAKLRQELTRARRALEEGNDAVLASANGSEPEDGARTDGSAEEDEGGDDQSQESPSERDAALQLDALKQLVEGRTPAFIYCQTAMDALHAIDLTNKFQLNSILVLGRNCYRAAGEIAASKLPVILDPTLVFWRTDPRTEEDEKIVLPRIYREQKVPVTFQVSQSGNSTLGTRYLWFQAATAVKYGMPVDEALEAITLRPARLLGVADFVGSIEPGKDGDLVVLSGDPLDVETWVDVTIVNGRVAYERDRDRKLRLLLQPDQQR